MTYRSNSSRGYSRSGGFTKSNGTHVSSARAHQRTGQSFGGYAKVRTGSGGFRMTRGK